jgi:hypothetical protein
MKTNGLVEDLPEFCLHKSYGISDCYTIWHSPWVDQVPMKCRQPERTGLRSMDWATPQIKRNSCWTVMTICGLVYQSWIRLVFLQDINDSDNITGLRAKTELLAPHNLTGLLMPSEISHSMSGLAPSSLLFPGFDASQMGFYHTRPKGGSQWGAEVGSPV